MRKWLIEKSDGGLLVIEAANQIEADSIGWRYAMPECGVVSVTPYFGKHDAINARPGGFNTVSITLPISVGS